jgi:hypothetical protein
VFLTGNDEMAEFLEATTIREAPLPLVQEIFVSVQEV